MCPFFICLGIKVSITTLPIIITMLVAAFIIHAGDPFQKLSFHSYMHLLLLDILISGPGKYSLDKKGFFKMELTTKSIIERPSEEVFELVRDNLEKIVPFLPNVEKIEVKKHAPIDEDNTEVINHWYGKVEMPSLLKISGTRNIFMEGCRSLGQ